MSVRRLRARDLKFVELVIAFLFWIAKPALTLVHTVVNWLFVKVKMSTASSPDKPSGKNRFPDLFPVEKKALKLIAVVVVLVSLYYTYDSPSLLSQLDQIGGDRFPLLGWGCAGLAFGIAVSLVNRLTALGRLDEAAAERVPDLQHLRSGEAWVNKQFGRPVERGLFFGRNKTQKFNAIGFY